MKLQKISLCDKLRLISASSGLMGPYGYVQPRSLPLLEGAQDTERLKLVLHLKFLILESVVSLLPKLEIRPSCQIEDPEPTRTSARRVQH